jgi:hypothetical protein
MTGLANYEIKGRDIAVNPNLDTHLIEVFKSNDG